MIVRRKSDGGRLSYEKSRLLGDRECGRTRMNARQGENEDGTIPIYTPKVCTSVATTTSARTITNVLQILTVMHPVLHAVLHSPSVVPSSLLTSSLTTSEPSLWEGCVKRVRAVDLDPNSHHTLMYEQTGRIQGSAIHGNRAIPTVIEPNGACYESPQSPIRSVRRQGLVGGIRGCRLTASSDAGSGLSA